MILDQAGYKGNSLLKKAGFKQQFTTDQIDEFLKCAENPIYFCNQYLKSIDADDGLIPIKLRSYQEDMINSFHQKRRSIVTTCRRAGKSTAVCGYILWYMIFNNDKTVALLANKGETARELLGLIQIAYQNLPKWLQHGVIEFNKGSFLLENGSRVLATATSTDAIRGYTISLLYIDECAFIENWEKFSASVLPTIASGKKTKIILVSTPNGLNFYHSLWENANKKGKENNGYNPTMVTWHDVPNFANDPDWYENTLQTLNGDLVKFAQEYEVEFQGSTNTLIRGDKLKALVHRSHIQLDMGGNLQIYENAQKGHTYTITVDVAEGLGLDYSAMQVIDVTTIPYKQVAKYRNNLISPYLFPTVIIQVAQMYNEAFVLVEINSIGLQVSDTLHFEFGYENLIKIEQKSKQGQITTPGFKKRIAYGLKISNQTKMIGCANLKTMIENDKLLLCDKNTIDELKTFSAFSKTFKAEEGKNDDLVMGLVHFGWLTGQRYFKDNINNNIRELIQKEQMDLMDIDICPPPIIDNGLNQAYEEFDGDRWIEDKRSKYNYTKEMLQEELKRRNPFDSFDDWRSRL